MPHAALAAGGLDEDAAHRLGRRGEEMAVALPPPVVRRADQPQVGLVHQGRRVERLAGLLSRELSGG